ncbi:TetR/AcrR family transcriptional regulator [Embleya sp. MST-111070]|uniref:TetR/AcrR family transcriptional regulator n=1 Tax=Embleya sp. MST-111070 TaxID=3398231 RepID=UPI003F74169C
MLSDRAGAERHIKPRADRRAEIIRHACALFAKRGYGATTVRQIAESADMLSGSLYHHFPSKEAMLLEVLDSFFADIMSRQRATVERGDAPVETLRGLLRDSLEVIGNSPDAAIVVVGESRRLSGSDSFVWLSDRTVEASALWGRVLRRGVEEGSLRRDLHPVLLSLMLQSAVWGMAQWYRPSGRYDPDAAAGRLVDLFVRGIVRPGRYASQRICTLLGPARHTMPTLRRNGSGDDVRVEAERRMARVPRRTDARTRIRIASNLLFEQDGYAGTTVRRIADLAGVPVGSLAHHIGSKEQLLGELLGEFLGDLRTAFDKDAADRPEPVQRLAGLIGHTVEAHACHGVSTVLAINEVRGDELPACRLTAQRAKVSETWTRALVAGIRSGDFHPDLDPVFTQRVLRTAISTGSRIYRGMGVRDAVGLYREVALAGMAAS